MLRQTEMAQREQPVVSVFAIKHIIRPISMEPSLRRPKSVDVVETHFLVGTVVRLQSVQRMQRHGSAEQVGHGSHGEGFEATFR